MADQGTIKVRASVRPPVSGSTDMGDTDPKELVNLTVRVRPRRPS